MAGSRCRTGGNGADIPDWSARNQTPPRDAVVKERSIFARAIGPSIIEPFPTRLL